jgi:hypothetical protein
LLWSNIEKWRKLLQIDTIVLSPMLKFFQLKWLGKICHR